MPEPENRSSDAPLVPGRRMAIQAFVLALVGPFVMGASSPAAIVLGFRSLSISAVAGARAPGRVTAYTSIVIGACGLWLWGWTIAQLAGALSETGKDPALRRAAGRVAWRSYGSRRLSPGSWLHAASTRPGVGCVAHASRDRRPSGARSPSHGGGALHPADHPSPAVRRPRLRVRGVVPACEGVAAPSPVLRRREGGQPVRGSVPVPGPGVRAAVEPGRGCRASSGRWTSTCCWRPTSCPPRRSGTVW